MKRSWWSLALLPALLLSLPLGARAPIAATPTPVLGSAQGTDCGAVLAQLTEQADWFDQLLDPVLTTQQELLERQALYTKAHDCLVKTTEPLPRELEAARPYLEYFLILWL